jgi:hypothetical protein
MVNVGRNEFGGALPNRNKFHFFRKDDLPLPSGRNGALAGGGVSRPGQQPNLKALSWEGEAADPTAPHGVGVLDEDARVARVREVGIPELELGRGWLEHADPDRPAPLGNCRDDGGGASTVGFLAGEQVTRSIRRSMSPRLLTKASAPWKTHGHADHPPESKRTEILDLDWFPP